MPPLLAEYAAWPRWPSNAAILAVLMMTPRWPPSTSGVFWYIICAASRITLNVPPTFTYAHAVNLADVKVGEFACKFILVPLILALQFQHRSNLKTSKKTSKHTKQLFL